MLSETFEAIYRKSGWHKGSGPGSTEEATVGYRTFLTEFLSKKNIRSVVDLGCGDWTFSQLIDWSNIHYIGYDVAPSIISKNTELFGSENIVFQVLENYERLPAADLLIVKDVFIHLPPKEIRSILTVARQKYSYCLFTHDVSPFDEQCDDDSLYNNEIETGKYTYSDVRRSPFHVQAEVVYEWEFNSGSRLNRVLRFLMRGTGGEDILAYLQKMPRRCRAIGSPHRVCEWKKAVLLMEQKANHEQVLSS